MGLWPCDGATVIGAMGSLGAGPLACDGDRCDGVARLARLARGTGWEREKPSRERELSNDQSRARGWLGVAGGVAGDGEEVRAESEEIDGGGRGFEAVMVLVVICGILKRGLLEEWDCLSTCVELCFGNPISLSPLKTFTCHIPRLESFSSRPRVGLREFGWWLI
uniref:Uncharacterized protein n=1 Tax=Fagus sylvatica TaxID=28930 RepID=A0A2N9IM56_FAGSY